MNTTIITGGKNAGKTTALFSYYRDLGVGDGVAAVKVVTGDKVVGFDLLRLSDTNTVPFARIKDAVPDGWREQVAFGNFSFSQDGFDFADSVVKTAISSGISPIYLDEVGKLELNGGGFDALVEFIVSSNVDVVLTVRDINVEAVLRRYSITNPDIIEI